MLGNCQQIDLRGVFRNSVACSVKETAGAAPANAKRRKVAMFSDNNYCISAIACQTE